MAQTVPTVLNEPYQHNLSSCTDYKYDEYSCYGCYGCETGDDYCRGASYSGLELESVSLPAVLRYTFSATGAIPDALYEFAVGLGLDSIDAYEIGSEGDYYGDTVVVTMNDDMFAKLQEYYFTEDEANDSAGVLAYCRSKGLDTNGLAPVDAIVKQLQAEHPEVLAYFDVSTFKKVVREEVKLSKLVLFDTDKFNASEPVNVRTHKGSKVAFAVVYEEADTYVVLDGYKRLKYAQLSHAQLVPCIVISQDK